MIAAMLVMVLLSTYEAQIKRSYPTLEDVILASLELNREQGGQASDQLMHSATAACYYCTVSVSRSAADALEKALQACTFHTRSASCRHCKLSAKQSLPLECSLSHWQQCSSSTAVKLTSSS
eukprot:15907-Heterococcus_DN1.PRE.4